MRLDQVTIFFPIVQSRSSENYPLIITDSSGMIHYFNFDGTYDGHSVDPHLCRRTGTSLN